MKIYFVPKPGMSSMDQFELYRRQTPGAMGVWRDLHVTMDSQEADFRVAINYIPEPEPGIGFGRTILVGREPRHFQAGFVDLSDVDGAFAILHHDLGLGPLPVRWWVHKTYDELLMLKAPKEYNAVRLTAVMSDKAFLPGHHTRFQAVHALVRAGVPFHLFGRIAHVYDDQLKPVIRGVVNDTFDALYGYPYALAFENGRSPGYFTEKLADVFLSWCFPIYWGAPDISDWFSIHSMISYQSAQHTWMTLDTPPSLNQMEAIAEARDLILNKYNFWPMIYRVIENGGVW